MSFNIFDIAGSGMTAQRIKMDTVASNIANINTTRQPDGSKGVYVKKDVSFRTVYDLSLIHISEMCIRDRFTMMLLTADIQILLQIILMLSLIREQETCL